MKQLKAASPSARGVEDSGGGGDGCRTVLVGVKLDLESRELLTYALVKVAQSGDRVIALHVLKNTSEVCDLQGASSMLSLVQTFDSILNVYEGFCHLKQVDLKLKVCRGSSVRKVLVHEAKSYSAAKVIVGSSKTPHRIRSQVKVAKYCAKKLSKDFWVYAIENGKIVFQREGNSTGICISQDDNQQKNTVRLLLRSLSKTGKAVHSSTASTESLKFNQEDCMHLQKSSSVHSKKILLKKCFSCSPGYILPDTSSNRFADQFSDDRSEQSSLALVPIRTPDSVSSSGYFTAQDSPKSNSTWPMLRRVFHSRASKSPLHRISSKHSLAAVYPDQKLSGSDQCKDRTSNFDGNIGTIVPYRSFEKCFPKELQDLCEKYESVCRLFSYQELSLATSNFKAENMVGKGGSSEVYRGYLSDGKELAVKSLKPSEDVLKEFVSEIEIITSLHHKNIISLYGFCVEDNNLLLVYDFLSRGSLEENLHGIKKDSEFGWSERYKVALGVAEALDHLHNGSAQPVIHRDVKSSNILLSEGFEPQLSDFGLAQWASNSSHLTFTEVAGTFGYLAPEYFMFGKANEKIDVYAFGVVLLELLSGKMPISDENPKGQENLVMWAKPILEGGKILQLLDSSLGSDYDHDDQIERMVLAATLCIRRAPQHRPQISLVMKLLQADEEATTWARLQLITSDESNCLDGEACASISNIQSHLNLALLDVDDDSLSINSNEHGVSVDDYLKGRWSRTSSFD